MGKSAHNPLRKWSMIGILTAVAGGSAATRAIAAPQQTPAANLVFSSVEPCRVFDTRDSGDGALLKGETRGVDVVGAADLTLQGGKAFSGCGIPGFDKKGSRAQAIVLQVTVLDSMGSGTLTVWSADRKMPEIPTLSFGAESRGATLSTIVPLRQDFQGQDIQIHATESADVLVDVVGFYTALRKEDFLAAPEEGKDSKRGSEKADEAGSIRGTDETVTGNLFVLGNLGIGTTSPGGQLEVSGVTSGTGVPKLVFRNQVNAVGFASAVQFGAGGSGPLSSANVPSDILAFVTQTDPMKGGVAFRTNRGGTVQEAMRVEDNGRVGIGTTTPGERLDVSGGNIRTSGQLVSTAVAGAPLVVSSTTKVVNLNAELFDSLSSSSFLRSNADGVLTGSLTINTGAGADVLLTEDGVDRNAAAATTYTIQNSNVTAGNVVQLLIEGGTSSSAPDYSFTADVNTGIFNPSADRLSFVTGATQRMTIADNGVVSIASDGTAAAPSLVLGNDLNSGIFVGGTDILAVTTGGVSRVQVGATGVLNVSNAGTAALPALTLAGDANTGLFQTAADEIGMSTAGVERLRVNSAGNTGVGETAPTYRLDVKHGGATGIRSRSTATFSVVDIDGSNGDAALRFAKAGVNQWNIRNDPSNDNLQVFELGGGGERMRIENTTGNVVIVGSLSKGSGSFRIDHPLDPANKYLYHSFVESPDMMNIYNGNVVTDASGRAVVTLPNYFEALNMEFRYQLTVMGSFARAMVSRKVEGNEFEIATDEPNVEVSWMVTGIRHDAFANQHRIPNEVEKAPQDKGRYIHPTAFNLPQSRAIGNEELSGEPSSVSAVKPRQ